MMSRIRALDVEDLPEQARENLDYAIDLMGFMPNDVLTMARWPEFLEAAKQLVDVVYGPGELDPVLKRMVATIVSGATGCRYCQAHTAHGAVRMAGADQAKIAAVWEFETNELFTPAERAALGLALAAAQQPNAATDEHFSELERHFSTRAILEIVGMICTIAFLNRWNDTVATELEDAPFNFARQTYDESVWSPGKHRRG
jgi:AhpD family alkylhydroperoxidase